MKMQWLPIKIYTFVICCIQLSTAANILAVFPIASPSHHIWNTPLVVTLAQRGHNVTVVGPEALKTQVPNLTDIVITGLYEAILEEFNYEEIIDVSPLFTMGMFFDYSSHQCLSIQKHDAWKQLMNYPPDTKFDLLITESIGAECLLGGIQRFGDPPIVSINAFNVPFWMLETSGTPNMLSHIPHYVFTGTDHMTFWQRVTNAMYYIYSYYHYYYNYLPAMDKAAREYYGPNVPSYSEVQQRISISMANYHPVLDYPFAITPNLIPVAGMQIKDPKPLPQDLQNFLDGAKEGVIFFSLGTNLRSEKLTPEKRKALMEAFAELPQKVLWKFEADSLPGQPKNVKIGKWLPQSDILAHPNVKLFISHCGLLSTHEAIYRGIPILGIPFFADQPINIRKLVNNGAAIQLDFKDLTKESLLKTLYLLLNDPSYRENMKKLSAKFRDNPETPLERAVFWTEYVLRHKNVPHLQSAAKDLNFAQYFLLDVLAFLLAIPVLFIILLFCVCCRRKSTHARKQKLN
ncbi:hypothetical protein R5R35_012575 [Gryllus longicercus]|uniref:UDP-glucuronosyltransferase n=1 Tax=Gryllus longicercus TaxID=2509291 RepID=A0AAN9VXQ9_9ORTH